MRSHPSFIVNNIPKHTQSHQQFKRGRSSRLGSSGADFVATSCENIAENGRKIVTPDKHGNNIVEQREDSDKKVRKSPHVANLGRQDTAGSFRGSERLGGKLSSDSSSMCKLGSPRHIAELGPQDTFGSDNRHRDGKEVKTLDSKDDVRILLDSNVCK
eukprot:CAMPEP_0197527720 /NCGR_PEP_ID=MMETSP1318-20131121/22623_1 /TAXON_ID=552666 /ORGANISM="Partenskyella glossopodia, Strain RCC365" /LENGTH=157 /DNA_ID=CAMNT_0043082505 /DNA_START=1205 /DNA_END=1678 /DNA_ORIENTATION=-